MVANPDKFQAMFLGMREQPKLTLGINDITIPLMNKVKLLGVTTDSKFMQFEVLPARTNEQKVHSKNLQK